MRNMDTSDFRVPEGRKVSLKAYKTDHTRGVKNKEDAAARLERNKKDLADYQERLYAQDRFSLLIVFQARDGAGKDSTIKHVMSGVNPQGVHVTSFKAPTSLEIDHDYLWRSVLALPQRGMIGIHNRSHYEEVIVTRVHPEILQRQRLPDDDFDKKFWARRFRQINDWERHLTENGTVILKFFLHVSKAEQRRRFLERIDKAEKNWKFSAADLGERALWKKFDRAYEDMLSETSTEVAPWYVVPADHKWYTRLVVGELIVKTLKRMPIEMPTLSAEERRRLADARKSLVGGA